MDLEVAAFEIEQAARSTEIVQQMAIDMKEIGVIAEMGNDVLVPDLGQHRAAGVFQWPILPLASQASGIRRRQPFSYGLLLQAGAFPTSKHSRPHFG